MKKKIIYIYSNKTGIENGIYFLSSSHVKFSSLKMEPSPHEIKRGCPSTHVIR